MKANKAPKKIWIDNLDEGFWFDSPSGNKSVEYIRKDAFIEKAWEWIEDNMLSSNQQDKSRLYYEQFKKYLEE